MRLYGTGLAQGMAVTLKHVVLTYITDAGRLIGLGRKSGKPVQQGPGAFGIFTVQYPEERLATSERFRVLPMLLYDEKPEDLRCTACGICARVCPPQCIWIVQAKDPAGKPVQQPSEFTIDINVCMNCGYCAEYCPFDAIKMDTRSEICSYDRSQFEVLAKDTLSKPASYYAGTHPVAWKKEQDKKARITAAKVAASPSAGSTSSPQAGSTGSPQAGSTSSPQAGSTSSPQAGSSSGGKP